MDKKVLSPPIIQDKAYEQDSVFIPENLLREARRQNAIAGVFAIFLFGCQESPDRAGSGNDGQPEFKGKIAKSYEESEEWWPKKKRPPAHIVVSAC